MKKHFFYSSLCGAFKDGSEKCVVTSKNELRSCMRYEGLVLLLARRRPMASTKYGRKKYICGGPPHISGCTKIAFGVFHTILT